jgi:hypothetical protein
LSSKRTPLQSWFRSPTEEAVMWREECRKWHFEPPKIYICSPFKGDTKTNVQNALRYCRFAVNNGMFPIAPHCYLPRFMNDDNAVERELALSFGLRLMYGCKEVWVFGERISDGMRLEIETANERNIRVRYFSDSCKEVTTKCYRK